MDKTGFRYPRLHHKQIGNRLKHKHHVIPRHMGGNDTADNLIELSIEEHAEAHRILFEKYGFWQDYIAWQGLLNLMTTEECAFKAMSEGGKKGSRSANRKRWGENIVFKDDPNYIPYTKRQFGYDTNVDGRKVRKNRYWFNNGKEQGQYSLENHPIGWKRGGLPKNLVMMGAKGID